MPASRHPRHPRPPRFSRHRYSPRRLIRRCLPALLTLAGAAHAQSGLTLYGFVDAGLFKTGPGSEARLGTIQRSYVGLRGQEALGQGWAATFHLMTRFDAGNGSLEASGATPFFQGESTVGLKSPYGDVRLGRALTPMWQYDWNYDNWSNFNRVASVAWYVFHPSYRSDPYRNGPAGEYSRLNNGVFYDSPTWGGLHFHAALGVERSAVPDAYGQVDQARPLAASLNYDAGPWSTMVAAERNAAADNTWFAGLAYLRGAFKLMASYSQTRLGAASQRFLGEAGAHRSAATLGADWRLGATTLKVSAARDFQGYGQAGATDYVSAGFDYALSRRTTLYGAAMTRHSRHAPSATLYGAGMSHSF